jgi:hypothetical protein
MSASRARSRLGAVALAVAGVLFVLYPAVRPWQDESTVEGATKAMSAGAWVAAHLFAMVGFILVALGLGGRSPRCVGPQRHGSPRRLVGPQRALPLRQGQGSAGSGRSRRGQVAAWRMSGSIAAGTRRTPDELAQHAVQFGRHQLLERECREGSTIGAVAAHQRSAPRVGRNDASSWCGRAHRPSTVDSLTGRDNET